MVSLGLHGHGVRVTSGEPCAGTKEVILGKSLLRSQDIHHPHPRMSHFGNPGRLTTQRGRVYLSRHDAIPPLPPESLYALGDAGKHPASLLAPSYTGVLRRLDWRKSSGPRYPLTLS